MNISQNISLIEVNDRDYCEPANPKDCLTVALYVKVQLEFINRPVHSLVLEVEVRSNDLNFVRKVKKTLIFLFSNS